MIVCIIVQELKKKLVVITLMGLDAETDLTRAVEQATTQLAELLGSIDEKLDKLIRLVTKLTQK